MFIDKSSFTVVKVIAMSLPPPPSVPTHSLSDQRRVSTQLYRDSLRLADYISSRVIRSASRCACMGCCQCSTSR